MRLALDGGQRRPAFHLMSAAIICLLVTDFVYGLMILHGTYDHQLWLDVGWIGFYLLWGAAALHPSMCQHRPAGREAWRALTPIPPDAADGRLAHRAGDRDGARPARRATTTSLWCVLGSILLFGLVVSRMAGLVRQQERSLERERMLSAAGADLVAATSREEIDEVALTAARAMAGPDLLTRLCSGSDGTAMFARPAVGRAAPGSARRREVVRLPAEVLAELGAAGRP